LALGNASYSIYLWHLFTLGALRIVWVRYVLHESLVSAVAFIAVALAGLRGGRIRGVSMDREAPDGADARIVHSVPS
jgi:hypothetical protein